MSVSFTLLKANGHSFDPLPGHDDREFSLSNANAATSSTLSASKSPSPNAPGQFPASGCSSSSPGASALATPLPPSLSPKPGSRGRCS